VLPIAKPRPDAERLLRILGGEEIPDRPPLTEYIADGPIIRQVIESMLGRQWVNPVPGDRASQAAFLDNYIAFWYHLGYDTIRLDGSLPLPFMRLATADTAPGANRERHWADEHQGPIASWDDFERYPWPTVDQVDFFAFEYAASHLPEGMGLMLEHNGHMYELLSNLFSYEGLCFALIDQPELVQAVDEKMGQLLMAYYEQIADIDNVVAFWAGDDMGFRTSTLISPTDLRRFVLPWHTRQAAIAHEHGIKYFLHSCGQLDAIYPDLIEQVQIDGKHSFEDVILPAEEFHRRYSRGEAGLSRRVATMGGVDVDILARGNEDEVRARTRQLIEACGPYGRFGVGSGNSITNYVPLPSYLAMLEEAQR
jgi:uroporphyrinogen decarboxylase